VFLNLICFFYFSYFAAGNFRLFLVGSIVVGLGLCVEEVRSQVAGVLERGTLIYEATKNFYFSAAF